MEEGSLKILSTALIPPIIELRLGVLTNTRFPQIFHRGQLHPSAPDW